MCEKIELKAKSSEDWIEVFPHDLIVGIENSRPILIFKDKEEKYTLPVTVSVMDAEILTHSGITALGNSPHDATLRIINELGVNVTKCVFSSIKGYTKWLTFILMALM